MWNGEKRKMSGGNAKNSFSEFLSATPVSVESASPHFPSSLFVFSSSGSCSRNRRGRIPTDTICRIPSCIPRPHDRFLPLRCNLSGTLPFNLSLLLLSCVNLFPCSSSSFSFPLRIINAFSGVVWMQWMPACLKIVTIFQKRKNRVVCMPIVHVGLPMCINWKFSQRRGPLI